MAAVFSARSALTALLFLGLLTACSFVAGPSLYVSGTRALDRGETARAITDLEEAARLMPEASEVQNHLGIAYENAGRKEEALIAWRRAVALDCSNAAAVKNLRDAEAFGPHDPASVAGGSP